jgi:hypothetical protein
MIGVAYFYKFVVKTCYANLGEEAILFLITISLNPTNLDVSTRLFFNEAELWLR